MKYKIRRFNEIMDYSDTVKMIDLAVQHNVLFGEKNEFIFVYHMASETDPLLYPEGWYQDDYYQTVEALRRSDEGISSILDELVKKGVDISILLEKEELKFDDTTCALEDFWVEPDDNLPVLSAQVEITADETALFSFPTSKEYYGYINMYVSYSCDKGLYFEYSHSDFDKDFEKAVEKREFSDEERLFFLQALLEKLNDYDLSEETEKSMENILITQKALTMCVEALKNKKSVSKNIVFESEEITVIEYRDARCTIKNNTNETIVIVFTDINASPIMLCPDKEVCLSSDKSLMLSALHNKNFYTIFEDTINACETEILYKVLRALKIEDVFLHYDNNNLIAEDSMGNKWKNEEFYKFLVDEAFVFNEDGSVLGIDNYLLSEFKILAGQYAIKV